MNFLKEKLPIFLTVQICIALLVYAYGCEPMTKSLLDPETKITSRELETELQVLLLQHESRVADINRQIEIRNLIFEQGLLIAESGTINPVGLITSLLAVVGIGVSIDDVRLRKKIKET